MTDINQDGIVRETLYTINPSLQIAGIVREVLLTSPTSLTFAGVVREVLLVSPPRVISGQTGVTISA
jgi:hypothetical protein